jgi:hypothetical protein
MEYFHPHRVEISERPQYDRQISFVLQKEKPWLQCGIEKWERFLHEPAHAHLLRAAEHEHNPEEWVELYDRCVTSTRWDDASKLLRLIFAQTRAMNQGKSNILFPRAGEAEEYIETMLDVAEDLGY